ncbi:hypothetical protein VT84_24290 [Gemmata sp. SH-PL17]|uniref:hypothetical protein n=1 Tax=Gemmata sp. SH-PL17 TaxID=1630693 RepID=UPI00078DF467|nr:hypothetical protein [Gemmata sp. SH-PL17]AMV27543.1 hypothetical protein VT84_24290 [Gemmata sp. SH-PL17]
MPATPNSRLRTLGQPPEPDGLGLLRRELAAKTRRVEETLLNLDNLISPTDWLDAGDGFPGFGAWRWNRPGTRDQDRTHAPITYLNEEDWRQHVALARDLCQRNHLALGFRDHVANFIGPISVSFVLRGQSPGASASGPIDADGDGEPDVDPIVKEATQAWDEWRELAEWGEGEHDREAECRTRLIVEGECTLRFFTGDARSDGLPHVRHVEPELIRTPPGASTTDPWGWGIKCTDDDDECEEALWLCRPDNPDDGREVRSSEYVRAKANVDRTVKRGLSDFFSVAEHLRKVLGLLDNMGHVARLQSAIAWWEQYPTATEAQVRAMIQSGTDYSRPKAAPGSPARTTDVQNYEPGSIIRTEAGRQVQPGPVATGVAGYAQVEALLLRGVGFRWGCPSYFSGDADASFASVLVTGSPFVRITEARQEKVKGFARAVARRVLEFCERTGRLPRGTTQRVRPIATARPVVIADEEKQARTFLALYQQKCADPIEFVRKRGGDPKVVAANILAWQKKFAPPDQPPSGAGPGGPFPSPPGSAGGDGSSPNAAPVGESRRVRENYNEADHPRDDHGQWVHKDDIQAAKSDPAKADELRAQVTHPAQRAKLDALLSSGTPNDQTVGTAAPEPEVVPSVTALKGLFDKKTDAERLEILKAASQHASNKALILAEGGGALILGPSAKWQSAGDSAVTIPEMVGDGYDFHSADGSLYHLTDIKVREKAGGPRSVVHTETSPDAKLTEANYILAAHPNTPVVIGSLHFGSGIPGDPTSGATFVTGFPGGGKKDATYSADARGGKRPKGKLLYDNTKEWERAVDARLASPADDAPLPALQIHPTLTTTFKDWTLEKVEEARTKYQEAAQFLTTGERGKKYRALLERQVVDRVVDGTIAKLTAVQGDEQKAHVITEVIKKRFPNNKHLAEKLAQMDIYKKAVYANSTPEELAQAASGMPDEHKTDLMKQTAATMSPEARKKLIAELLAAENNPPTTS